MLQVQREQWTEDTPFCVPHWRPLSICVVLEPHTADCQVAPETAQDGP
jgi:hypothetical protein